MRRLSGQPSSHSYGSFVWVVLVLPGYGHAQAPPCTNPTITSVSPDTWPLGTATNVTITGTGFDPVPIPDTCSSSFVDIIPKTGSVTVTNTVIVSSTQVTLTVQPAAADPAEGVCVEVGNNVEFSSGRPFPKARTLRRSAASEATGTGGCLGVTVYTNIAQATAYLACPPQTVTSISPNVWFAGQSYNLTIMGTGFTTSAAATSACPVSTVGVTTPPTNPSVNVAVSAINVVSSTEITVTVNPTSAPYTGPPLKSPAPVSAIGATLEVAPTSSSGGPSPGASPALGTPEAGGALAPNVDVLLAPQILWNGNAIGGSGASAQSAVVGQQLALTTTPTAATLAALPVPLTLAATAPTTWTVTGGTNIGGYTPTSTSYSTGSVTPMPPLTTPNLTFYSVYPADPVDLTYTYCVTGQTTCPNADATFNVTGPSGGTLTGTPYSGGFTIQDWTAYGSCISPAGLYLEYGNYTFTSPSNCQFTGTPGIAFSANVQVQPPSGTAFPVQLVTGGSLSGGKNCTMSAGLDPAGYPYPNINDSPAVELLPTYTTQSRQESFQIYLMWAYSSNSPYIPVPIGYLPWNISGSASCSTSCGSASSWTPSTNSSGTSVGSYVPIQQSDMTPQNNFGYPIWGGPTSCN